MPNMSTDAIILGGVGSAMAIEIMYDSKSILGIDELDVEEITHEHLDIMLRLEAQVRQLQFITALLKIGHV